jgi:hypothetical protein
MAPLFGDLADEAGEPVELRIERGAATADLQNLRVSEADHLAERGVRSRAVFAIIDLTDDEVDDLALLWLQRRFSVLQREVSTERRRGMSRRGVWRPANS